MNALNSVTLIVRALLFSFVVVLAGGSKSNAQEADIKAAVDAYHAALGLLDLSKMEPLWAHDANADRSILRTETFLLAGSNQERLGGAV